MDSDSSFAGAVDSDSSFAGAGRLSQAQKNGMLVAHHLLVDGCYQELCNLYPNYLIRMHSHSSLACRKNTESTICANRQGYELAYVSLCSTHSDSGQIRALKEVNSLKDVDVRFG